MSRLLLADGTNAVMRRATVAREMTPQEVAMDVLQRLYKAGSTLECTHIIVLFDDPKGNWRYDAFPAYKGKRKGWEFNTLEYLRAAWTTFTDHGLFCHMEQGQEADDDIASLATRAARAGWEVCTLSSDNDLLQLVGRPGITVVQYNDAGQSPWLVARDANYVAMKFNVTPKQYPTFLTLVGGKNDVPGVPGIGPVGAGKLLAEFEGLDELVAEGKIPEDSREMAYLALKLHTLRTDVPIPAMNPQDFELGRL